LERKGTRKKGGVTLKSGATKQKKKRGGGGVRWGWGGWGGVKCNGERGGGGGTGGRGRVGEGERGIGGRRKSRTIGGDVESRKCGMRTWVIRGEKKEVGMGC